LGILVRGLDTGRTKQNRYDSRCARAPDRAGGKTADFIGRAMKNSLEIRACRAKLRTLAVNG
jgi:hypothetical protein